MNEQLQARPIFVIALICFIIAYLILNVNNNFSKKQIYKEESSKQSETKYKEKQVIKITKPDGTIIEKVVEKDKETKNSEKTIVSSEKIENKKEWKLGIEYIPGSLAGLNQPKADEFRLRVERRVIGDIFAGISTDIKTNIGVGISIEF